ncbi:uncharacterized protein [Littorina saxatilis]|uniref:uncharacterized protein n=1 Tax=Littorina saxatilis TaxID=31220 RepID=UPI0038B66FEF
MDSDPDSARNLLTHTDSKTFTPSSTNNNINGSPNTTRHNNHNQSLQQKPETMGTKNKTYAGGSSAQGVAMGYHDTARLQKRVARLTSYLYGLAVIVVVGGVILIAIIASLYAKLYYDLTHHSHQPKVGEQIAKILEREELCVPCSEVRLGPSPDEENMLNVFTKRDSKDGQKCCVERPAELLRLLELVSFFGVWIF